MTTRRTTDEIIAHLHTRQDLLDAGHTVAGIREATGTGQLIRLRHNIYIRSEDLNSIDSRDQHLLALAVCFRASPQTVFSHESAAAFLNLPLLYSRQRKIHIYCATNCRNSLRNIPQLTKHVRLTPQTPRIITSSGVHVTDYATTLIDCCQSLPFSEAVIIADFIVHNNLLPHDDLQAQMLSYSGLHKAKVHRVAQAMSGLAESPGETLVRLQLDQMGIAYTEQAPVLVRGRYYRADFLLDDYGVYLEFDGIIKYTNFDSTDRALIRERQREKELLNAGARVIRVGWKDVFPTAQPLASLLRQVLR